VVCALRAAETLQRRNQEAPRQEAQGPEAVTAAPTPESRPEG
jgi:hypothetical protein